ncbi:rRNA methyltransferase 3, mitochondrial [Elgaria multicarinata webbii]|uniref:rRNA methyltransferase 3, mitochondrial n=1 Tax=Elgaria multicarinata webbii TaxID=159646 RepID=UPI002FCD14E6
MAALVMPARASLLLLLLRPAWAGAAVGRRGVRALRRSPVRVLPSLAQAQEQQLVRPSPPQVQRGPAPKARADPGSERKEPKKAAASEQPEPEEKLSLHYERAGPGDKRLSKVVTLAKSRDFRERHGKILLEGRRLITDALAAGAVPQTLFFSTVSHVKELPVDKLKGASLVKVKFEDLKAWSDVITPQGVIGIFSRPDHSKMTYPEVEQQHALPLTLICDNIRDPGNLGTILRSAAGAGCSRILLVKGCVDAWEPKVLRAGMGAHFRLPITSNLEWKEVPSYLLPGTHVHVADGAQAVTQAEPVLSAVASGHGWVSRPSNLKAQPDWDIDGTGKGETFSLDVHHYYERWMDIPAAVVVGGETHGVSADAEELAQSTGGRRLLIPVVPGVDSLNSAMAASIVLFEAKRQLAEVGTAHASGLRLNSETGRR